LRSNSNVIQLNMRLLFTLVLTILTTSVAHTATIYVNENATGANTGTNWADAFNDLQDAIALSVFGDEIWVAQGVYKPTSGTSRSEKFSIKNGIQVYGGFAGGETNLSQRDLLMNETVLSGEIATGSATDNSYIVVLFSNVSNQTRLDGFTITGAYHNGVSAYGGGAQVVASSPTIANCTFQGNYAEDGGGALNHSMSGILTLENCVFDGNVANSFGGGALRLYTGTANITNCYFTSNQSNTYAGAIYIYNAIVNVSNSIFAGNLSQTSGSAIRIGDIGTLHLSNSLLVGNYTNTTGTITTSTFSNSGSHTIRNCTIAHNKHDNSSGSSTSSAVALNNEATVTNSIIYGNNSINQVLGTGLTFDYNITQNSTNNATGTGNLYTDPLFVSPGNVNNAPFDTSGYDYQLGILSGGIDTGLNANASGTNDLAGNVRIQNSIVDLGAYESSFCISTSQFTTQAPYTICGGTPITLEVDNGVNYIWSDGSTSNPITVNTAGSYSVIFEDASGCRGSLTANVTVNQNPSPTITFTSGNLDAGNFSSYQWFFNGFPINGATNSLHTPIEGYGLYEVLVTNAGGCEGSASYCLSPSTLSANGPTTFCEGEDVVLTASDGDSYVWSTGSLTPSITVNTSGMYSVTVFNTLAGCSVILEQDITVNPNPNPIVSFNGQNLSTASFTSYQWNFNGNPISGATSQNLDPATTGNGQYSVTVTNSNGCEATSSVYSLTDLSLNEKALSSLEYYPNPNNGNFIIVGNTIEVLSLTDATGRVLNYNQNQVSNGIRIEVEPVKPGVYFLEVENNSQRFVARIIIE